MEQPTCPFCHAPIDEELLRYGGRCPHCLIEIPGEETPTDPAIPVEEEPLQQSSPRRTWLAGAGALLLLLVAGGSYAILHGQEAPAQYGTGSAQDDFYLAPLETIEQVQGASSTQAGSSGQGGGGSGTASSGSRGSSGRRVASTGSAGGRHRRKLLDFRNDPSVGEATASEPFENGVATFKPDLGDPELGPLVLEDRSVGRYVLSTPEEIREGVGNRLASYGKEINACYEMRLKDSPTLAGSWLLSFTIGKDGRVREVQVVPQGVKDSVLEDCIARKARDWTFPPISQEMAFEKVYHLSPTG